MQTTADPLEHARLTAAHKEAIVCGSDRLDYQTLWSRCGRLAGYLAGLGLQRGDRVAVVAANCHRYLEAYLTVPAARIPGSVVAEVTAPSDGDTLTVGHPSGTMPIWARVGSSGGDLVVERAAYARTARRLAEGYAFVRRSTWEG